MSETEQNLKSKNGDGRHSASSALRAVTKAAHQVRRADEQLIDRVREQPIVAVAIALAAGYFIGRAFSRWG